MEQQLKKKKKRIGMLAISESCVEDSRNILDDSEIQARLKAFFRLHIGRDNSAHASDVFKAVMGKEASSYEYFERGFIWNIIKRVMRSMRRNDILFTIQRGSIYFVLQTQKESNEFKLKTDKHIQSLKDLKAKADNWVRYSLWKDF